jgi:hypothetical protein
MILLDVPSNARVYRAVPIRDESDTELSGDLILMPLERYDDLVARVALAEARLELAHSD